MRSRNHCCRGRATSITYWSVCACLCVRVCMWIPGIVSVCTPIRAHSLANRARNAYAPYCDVICGPPVSTTYLTLYHIRCNFRKKVIEHKMCVFIFSTTSVQNITHFKSNLARYRQKCRNVLMYSTHYSCRILMKLEFSRQIFEKVSNIKFHKNPSSGNRVPCGQTDTKL
jgi:hypothetical protein